MKNGGPSIGKVREGYVESRHIQGCTPPLVSVRDRWVGPCEQVLNVLTAYQKYKPDKPSSLLSIDA
jgi:hypothetical protein